MLFCVHDKKLKTFAYGILKISVVILRSIFQKYWIWFWNIITHILCKVKIKPEIAYFLDVLKVVENLKHSSLSNEKCQN